VRAARQTDSQVIGRSAEADRVRPEVREIELPVPARALSTLPRIDYTDAFRLTIPGASRHTGEEWARAILEGAPAPTRAMLRRGWFALGLHLGSSNNRRLVLGWAVRRRSPEFVVLGARSLLGMEAELLFRRERSAILFATLLKLNNPLFRTFWGAFSPQHRRIVRHLLKEAGRREA
jgi:Protein of unknown function (DUF2867)